MGRCYDRTARGHRKEPRQVARRAPLPGKQRCSAHENSGRPLPPCDEGRANPAADAGRLDDGRTGGPATHRARLARRPARKMITGAEAEARLLLPLRSPGRQFESFTAAVRYLDRPTLFENRPTFRLLEAGLSSANPRLRFSLGTYFEMIDVSQAVGYELASAMMAGHPLSIDQLAFRSLIGDPFDLQRRPTQIAVNALTIRRDPRSGTATFVLHWRDPTKVAIGGGLYSVMPVGVFQPSTVDPWGQRVDFDLWRNLVREFSEEFLGMPEHDGSSGAQIDYEMWPLYRTLTSARDAGRLRVHCFGLGIDPLGLGLDLLTAVVIDSDVFDAVFGDLVRVNAEGHVIANNDPNTAVGFPFVQESVDRFTKAEPMGPGGAAC